MNTLDEPAGGRTRNRMNDNPIASRIGDNWTCPYCGHAQVISKERCTHLLHPLNVAGWSEGKAGYFVQAIVCANSQCKKLSVNFGIVDSLRIFHAGALTSPRSLPNGASPALVRQTAA